MSCDFCSKIKPDDYPVPCRAFPNVPEFTNDSLSNNLDMIIKKNILNLSYNAYSVDSSFYEDIEINFCPMCGKKLSM